MHLHCTNYKKTQVFFANTWKMFISVMINWVQKKILTIHDQNFFYTNNNKGTEKNSTWHESDVHNLALSVFTTTLTI